MPFWRRRGDEGPPEETFEIERSPGVPPEPAPPPEAAEPEAAYAPFDPTAFLAVAPAHTLDQGLERQTLERREVPMRQLVPEQISRLLEEVDVGLVGRELHSIAQGRSQRGTRQRL